MEAIRRIQEKCAAGLLLSALLATVIPALCGPQAHAGARAGGPEGLAAAPSPPAGAGPVSAEEFARTVHGRAGITCADCHASHGAPAGGLESTRICAGCHGDVERIYRASLHGRLGATHCVDCHDPHTIRPYRELEAKERIAVCAGCHGDYLKRHRWLPNTSLHFDYLECATCHSPRSEKGMVFYFARKTPAGKVRLSYGDLVALYGKDPAGLLIRGSADEQIGRLFTILSKRDKGLVIDASIIVTKAYHSYSETRLKERRCVTCHSRQAGFYRSMFFILPGRESADYIPVKGTILSAYPLSASVDFFLLGQDKIRRDDLRNLFGLKSRNGAGGRPSLGLKWIDFAGVLAIVLTAVAVSGHVILRRIVKQ